MVASQFETTGLPVTCCRIRFVDGLGTWPGGLPPERTKSYGLFIQGSMDSLTHDAYLERRELAWRTAGVVPDGASTLHQAPLLLPLR